MAGCPIFQSFVYLYTWIAERSHALQPSRPAISISFIVSSLHHVFLGRFMGLDAHGCGVGNSAKGVFKVLVDAGPWHKRHTSMTMCWI